MPPLPKLGHPEQGAQDCVQEVSEGRQGGEPTTSGQPVPVLCHTYSKEMLPDVQIERLVFQLVHSAFCPGTGHHLQESVSVLFAPSFQVFIEIDEFPLSLLFSRLSSPSSLSLSSRCCKPDS